MNVVQQFCYWLTCEFDAQGLVYYEIPWPSVDKPMKLSHSEPHAIPYPATYESLLHMSYVPKIEGLILGHYNEAVQDVEFKSSAFWQIWLQRAFSDQPEIYSVTCESSPDNSRRRVDMVVKRWDPDHGTFMALLWVECKRPSGSIKEVESQALDAGLRCIATDSLQKIYVMTTVGVCFRAWMVTAGEEDLKALHGSNIAGDKKSYVDAGSVEAFGVFQQVLTRVKTDYPLMEPIILPSQSQASTSQPEVIDTDLPPKDVKPAKEVKVKQAKDGAFVFKDSKGKERRTSEEQWTRTVDENGEEIYYYDGKNTRYFCRRG